MTGSATLSRGDPNDLYGAEYYHSHCGNEPYTPDSVHWQQFYAQIADEIVRSFTPRSVFDAGCAVGFLVAALSDRNVDAYGRDTSEFAISQVRADVREHCSVGSIADPIDRVFDVVTCIEVLEHMPEEEALRAIAAMTGAAPRVLFSSTPADFDEPTHINVRPIRYWLRHFAEAGYAPVVEYDATFVCPHAILFERSEEGRTERDLVAFAEIVRQRLARAAEASKTAQIAKKLSEVHAVLASEQAAAAAADAGWSARVVEVETDWRSRLNAVESSVRSDRGAASWLPHRVRQAGRRASRAAWWTVSLQLPVRLRARREWLESHRPGTASAAGATVQDPAETTPLARDAIARRFGSNDPLRTYSVPATERRLSVVTDSIGEGSLYGGVGTAMIIATLVAERLNSRLRLITRTEPADLQRMRVVFEAQGLAWPRGVESVHAPALTDVSVPAGGQDLFLTTSWWTTRALLQSVPKRRILYLLQEDERMFYPRGDDRLRCSETLADDSLHLLINSELLFRHFAEGPEPLTDLGGRASWFEPAFPEALFYDDRAREARSGKRSFLFYARPNNLRNLYWRGLEAVCAAIEEGVLAPDTWTFTFVGKDIERISLPGDVVPEVFENLPWDRYAHLVRGADLGLALMDTPHASYPPLDLAASGAVAVTNRCGVKQSLERYSRNIITVSPSVEDITRGLASGVRLLMDEPTRRLNYSESSFERDWRRTLEATVEACATWVEG